MSVVYNIALVLISSCCEFRINVIWRKEGVKHMMAGNEEQMRTGGGLKGFPLPAAHWTAMTTFSPEAPSSLHPAPLSALVIPPSICVHLPLPINSRSPHHNRSFGFSVSQLDVGEKSSALVFPFILFFVLLIIFTSRGAFLGAFHLFPAPLPPTSPPLPSSPPCRPVPRSFHYATPVRDPDLLAGAAHAGSI